MIRINLLPVERERRTTKRAFSFGGTTQQLTVACTLVLFAALGICGSRSYKIWRELAALDKEITAAQQETQRLRSIIQQVQQFEQRKAQLQQRVVLIEQLRKSQAGPVHMLDQISRALPPMFWLTELKQVGDDVIIDGRCTTLTELSDFVVNLERSGWFKKSVEVVSTQTEGINQPPGELITFSVKAQFAPPGSAAAPAKPAAPGGTSAASPPVETTAP